MHEKLLLTNEISACGIPNEFCRRESIIKLAVDYGNRSIGSVSGLPLANTATDYQAKSIIHHSAAAAAEAVALLNTSPVHCNQLLMRTKGLKYNWADLRPFLYIK